VNAAEIIFTVIASAGGAGLIIAGLGAWLGRVWADRLSQSQKLMGEIDLDLRKRRIDAYSQLWKSTGLLPQWPRTEGVTYEHLYEFSGLLRQWYYEVGGIYLSRTSHKVGFVPLQECLGQLRRQGRTVPLADADYESIRKLCSGLRTALANDIESRREGPA